MDAAPRGFGIRADGYGRPRRDPEVHRSGRGSPLLLLHGMGMSWHAWEPVLPLLARERSVIAPTLPGHAGGPSAPSGPVTVDALADGLCAQLDDWGLGEVDVAGNSLGGWLALELARRGRTRSVVALSPAGAWTTAGDMYRLRAALRTGMAFATHSGGSRALASARVRRLALGRMVHHPDRFTPDQAQRVFDDMAGCQVVDELVRRAVRTGQIVPFAGLPCPVTLAWAQFDRVIPFPRYGKPMLAALPGATLVALPGVGHVPMLDDPELVANTILVGSRVTLADGQAFPA